MKKKNDGWASAKFHDENREVVYRRDFIKTFICNREMGNSTDKFEINIDEHIQNLQKTVFPGAAGIEDNDKDTKDTKSKTQISHLVFKGDFPGVKEVITLGNFDPEEHDHDWNTPVHWACLKGRLDMLNELLKQGFRFKDKNKLGDTPLHFACSAEFADGVKLLLDTKADPWPRNSARATPLHYTVASGRIDIMMHLRGADPEQFALHVNDQTRQGDTALHWAAAKVPPPRPPRPNHHPRSAAPAARRGSDSAPGARF